MRDPALKKAVRKRFTNNYNKDKAFFKKIMGKSLGINDHEKHGVKKQWKGVSLTFTPGATVYEKQFQGKKPKIKAEQSKTNHFNTHRTSSKIGNKTTIYMQNYKPFVVQKPKPKKKKVPHPTNLPFHGFSHYKSTYIGLKSSLFTQKMPY